MKNNDLESFDQNGIIIGHRLSKSLNLKVNDEILLMTPQMHVTAFGSVPKQKKFIIINIFDVGMYEYDNGFVFINLSNAQSMFGYKKNDSIGNLEVYLHSTENIIYIII